MLSTIRETVYNGSDLELAKLYDERVKEGSLDTYVLKEIHRRGLCPDSWTNIGNLAFYVEHIAPYLRDKEFAQHLVRAMAKMGPSISFKRRTSKRVEILTKNTFDWGESDLMMVLTPEEDTLKVNLRYEDQDKHRIRRGGPITSLHITYENTYDDRVCMLFESSFWDPIKQPGIHILDCIVSGTTGWFTSQEYLGSLKDNFGHMFGYVEGNPMFIVERGNFLKFAAEVLP